MAVNRVPISIWHVRPSRSNMPAIGRRRRGAGLRCRVPRYWMITSGIYDSRCTAAILSRSCPLWVKSRHSRRFARCQLYPQKRTSPQRKRMSALCQTRTLSESLAGRLRHSPGDRLRTATGRKCEYSRGPWLDVSFSPNTRTTRYRLTSSAGASAVLYRGT